MARDDQSRIKSNGTMSTLRQKGRNFYGRPISSDTVERPPSAAKTHLSQSSSCVTLTFDRSDSKFDLGGQHQSAENNKDAFCDNKTGSPPRKRLKVDKNPTVKSHHDFDDDFKSILQQYL